MKRLVVALGLAVILQSGAAAATTYRYVRPTGTDSGTCGSTIANSCRTIGAAVATISVAEPTVIRVSRGDYTENLSFTSLAQSLAIEGGWDSDFSGQSQAPDLTRLTSGNGDPVVAIDTPTWTSLTLRLSSLSFQGTTDAQRLGIEAAATSANLDLAIDHCSFSTYRGTAIDVAVQDGSNVNFTLDQTVLQGTYQFPANNPWIGGGLSFKVYGSSSSTVTLTRNRFLDNEAVWGGGIDLWALAGSLTVTLENNIIAGNSATIDPDGFGGGLSARMNGTANLDLDLTNNTFADNVASREPGSSIMMTAADTAVINANMKNTIVWGEGYEIGLYPVDPSASVSLDADYSVFAIIYVYGGGSILGSEGTNLNVDPMLQRDYHLSPGSPARNAGLCGMNIQLLGGTHYIRIAPYDDIDGDPRPGFGTLRGCDIGADEYSFSWILFNPAFIRK